MSDEQRRDKDRKKPAMAIESPFRALGGQPKSVRDVIDRAEEQFVRYEERLTRQSEIINRLLEHHNRCHGECNYEGGEEK